MDRHDQTPNQGHWEGIPGNPAVFKFPREFPGIFNFLKIS